MTTAESELDAPLNPEDEVAALRDCATARLTSAPGHPPALDARFRSAPPEGTGKVESVIARKRGRVIGAPLSRVLRCAEDVVGTKSSPSRRSIVRADAGAGVQAIAAGHTRFATMTTA